MVFARNANFNIGLETKQIIAISLSKVYVVVKILPQVIFVFLLFLGMAMSANEVETKEK